MILSCAEYHEAYWQTNDLAPSENKESTKNFHLLISRDYIMSCNLNCLQLVIVEIALMNYCILQLLKYQRDFQLTIFKGTSMLEKKVQCLPE